MRGQPHGPLPRFVYVPMGAPQGQGHDEKNKVRSSCRGSRPRLPGGVGVDFCVILGEYVFISPFGNPGDDRVTDSPGPCCYHSLARRAVQEACPYGLDALHSSIRPSS